MPPNIASTIEFMVYKIYELVKSAGPDIFYKYNTDNGQSVKGEFLLEVMLDPCPNLFATTEEAYEKIKTVLQPEKVRNRRFVILPYLEMEQ